MLVSEKLDVLGERHDQAVVDLQQSMSKTHHITERETEVAMPTERCGGTGHIFTGKCTRQTERERESQGRPKARQSQYIFSICYCFDGKLEKRHMCKDNHNFVFHLSLAQPNALNKLNGDPTTTKNTMPSAMHELGALCP